ncbi:MAG TPA: lytic murein transglycosylase [Candidatus Paceibacterota bacterium]|nr:lytic murein transglycosylase [Candidatus Paceibacterota bacterium]
MTKFVRPKFVSDITTDRGGTHQRRLERVNLSYRRVFRIQLTGALKLFTVLTASWVLILGSVSAPTTQSFAATASPEERAALEAQLSDLENQIGQYEDQVVSYQKQGSSLKNEINLLNAKITQLNLRIRATTLQITDLDDKISEKQTEIDGIQEQIVRNRAALVSILNDIYQADRTNNLELFLKNPKLSDFFSNLNSLAVLQDNLRTTIHQISDLKDSLENEKQQYAMAKADATTLQEYQSVQKQEADQTKQQKNQLLTVTKGQESKYQQLLKDTKATAAQIRSRIFELLGGGELTFDQAYQYAKLASQATGVRPAMILAVLDRESALGKNVGKCSYQTAMSPKNQALYLQIVAELNISPDSVQVSCPNKDGVYGGAMGPAQFVPATWMLYRDKVATITGRSPASPWNNADAFVATGLYLADAGAANATSLAQERKAAARYYAGGNWSRFLWTYGEAVVSQAEKFQDDIDTLTA